MPVQISYVKLFEVKLTHHYFRGGVSGQLNLRPSRETAGVLQRLDIRTRFRENVFQAFLSVEKLEEITDQQFSFYLENSDPLFLNYTDLPLDFNPFKNKNILFLHNSGRDTKLFGEDETAEAIGQAEVSNFLPPILTLSTNAEENKLEDSTIWITNPATEDLIIDIEDLIKEGPIRTDKIIRSGDPDINDEYQSLRNNEVVASAKVRSGQTTFQIDLRDEEEGKYRISVNGEEKSVFCLLKNTQKPPLGMVEIFAEEVKNGWDETQKHGPVYEIAFAPRATQWKYYFISDSPDLTFDVVSVSQNRGDLNGHADQIKDISFIDLGPQTWMGKQAYVLTSDPENLIPLKEEQDYHFTYDLDATKKQKLGTKSVKLKGALPAGSKERLIVRKDDEIEPPNAQLCSEIYIYF